MRRSTAQARGSARFAKLRICCAPIRRMLRGMRAISAACVLLALGCATPSPRELRLEGEQALVDCERQRVDTSVCQSLELIEAEYRLCQRQRPGDAACDEVWRGVTQLSPPPRLPPPPLFQRGALRGP
jgi:hypothetical protein